MRLYPFHHCSQLTTIEKRGGLAGQLVSYRTFTSATMEYLIIRGQPLSNITQRLEGGLLPDGWGPSRLEQAWDAGLGIPYASEPLSSVSGCQQGSSAQLARYQTKYGQHNVQDVLMHSARFRKQKSGVLSATATV